MWKTLSRRVDRVERELYSGGKSSFEEALRFFGTLDSVQVHIFADWFNRFQRDGTADEGTLREHLSTYDENGVIFDYETGEYRQPTEREKGLSGEPEKKTLNADQVIEGLTKLLMKVTAD